MIELPRVREAALGFDANAADYERSRPTYPADAVTHLCGVAGITPSSTVLDLAAGTGKLTRLLVEAGAEVVAVEPAAAMRREFSAVLPGVRVLEGTAEAIPLDDACVDAVTVAQAFHWFDPAPALAEVRRVLRPGGTLALLWNTRDRQHDWVRCFGDLLVDGDRERPYDSYDDVDYRTLIASDGGGAFGAVRAWSTAWEQPCDEELLVARAASVSVVGVLGADDRAVVLDRVRHLARTHPDLAGRRTWTFPHTTRLFWCRAV